MAFFHALLTAGQEPRRVDWLALLANLEMQLHRVGVGIAHLGDDLTLGHVIAFFHDDRAVMGIGRQQAVAVLDDDEVTITSNAATSVHYFARARRHDLLSR